jgi:hypothetical protein
MAQANDPVASVVAGYIVWLAEQRFEPDYRHRCPLIAERFLRWQARRRQQELPSNVNAYCRELAIGGTREDELTDIRRIIDGLGKYLETSS